MGCFWLYSVCFAGLTRSIRSVKATLESLRRQDLHGNGRREALSNNDGVKR